MEGEVKVNFFVKERLLSKRKKKILIKGIFFKAAAFDVKLKFFKAAALDVKKKFMVVHEKNHNKCK